MATGERHDPYKGYSFRVEIDGSTRAGFRECSGPEVTHDLIASREGDEGRTTRKLPGLVKYANISLRRGISDDQDLWTWHNTATTGAIARRNGSIILLSDTGDELARGAVAVKPLRASGGQSECPLAQLAAGLDAALAAVRGAAGAPP